MPHYCRFPHAEDLTWFSGAANCEVRAPPRLLVSHFFNHQTHHRAQVGAMLTAAGQETGDTDLFLVVPEIVGHAQLGPANTQGRNGHLE